MPRKVTLDSLSEEKFEDVKKSGVDKLAKLCKGEIVINRNIAYLKTIRKGIAKALSLNYSYADIAKVIYDKKAGVTFTAEEIKEFYESNSLNKTTKDKGVKKANKETNKDNTNKDIKDNKDVNNKSTKKIDTSKYVADPVEV